MIETVILDWSGVVSDDLEAVWLTSNDILKGRGAKPVSLEQFKELFELPFMNFYKKIGVKITEEDERQRWDRVFPKYYNRVRIMPNAKHAIEKLKQDKKKIIVFSAHNQKLLLDELKSYGLQDLVNEVHASVNDKREEISKLIEKHEIEPSKTVYVGDMQHDIETANGAGIKSIAVLSGYDTKEDLEMEKPDYIINDLGELPGLIEKIEGEANG